MGQYHLTANIDKREFINPHKIGIGLKLREQMGFAGSTGDILLMLLACSNGRGGGDIQTDHNKLIGRWAGDRIAVIGDYSRYDDIPSLCKRRPKISPTEVFFLCQAARGHAPTSEEEGAMLRRLRRRGWDYFKDISDELIPLINEQFAFNIVLSDGWRQRVAKSALEQLASAATRGGS